MWKKNTDTHRKKSGVWSHDPEFHCNLMIVCLWLCYNWAFDMLKEFIQLQIFRQSEEFIRVLFYLSSLVEMLTTLWTVDHMANYNEIGRNQNSSKYRDISTILCAHFSTQTYTSREKESGWDDLDDSSKYYNINLGWCRFSVANPYSMRYTMLHVIVDVWAYIYLDVCMSESEYAFDIRYYLHVPSSLFAFVHWYI